MEEHGRWPGGANYHVFRLCPRRDNGGVGVWNDYVRARGQLHVEVTLRIRAKGGNHTISLLHREAGTERRVARYGDLANRLDRTADDGPNQRRVARRGRCTATCCPAEQSQDKKGRDSHGRQFKEPRIGIMNLLVHGTQPMRTGGGFH
jgi:hypothetical protein